MFNSRVYNRGTYNYLLYYYAVATLAGVGATQCNASAVYNTTCEAIGHGSISCSYVRVRAVTASMIGIGTVVAIAKQYIAAFGTAITIQSASGDRTAEVLTMPVKNNISENEGTIRSIIYLLRDPGTTEQFIFDANGSTNRSLQVLIRTDGKLAVRFGTGLTTVELTGGTALQKETAYRVAFGWSQDGVRLFLDGSLINSTSTVPDFSFGPIAYIGSKADGTNQLDGLLDDFDILSYLRSDADIQADSNSNEPLPVTESTMYKLDFDETLMHDAGYAWVSPVIDVSNAIDKASGMCSIVAETPGSSSVYIQSRSAPSNSGPWTDWVNALPDGTLEHLPDDFIQVRIALNRTGDDNPTLEKATVSFDGTPSVELLASDFTAEGQFYFTTLLDYSVMVNGLDAPRKYDGTTLSVIAGDPPHGNYVAAHKNRLWMTKGSRLYFSDILDIESWPVLNFIDISPNDGDYITGLMPVADYLVITKQHSVWLLTGEGISTFAVRRIHANRGAYAPRSLIMVNEMVCFVSDDGIYFSDFTDSLLISERVKNYWNSLNNRRLNQVACWHADHKLYVAVPGANSTVNDRVIVYDTLRQCFVGIIPNWNISCFSEFREGGKRINLFGHSNKGQVSEMLNGYNDSGTAIPFKWKSRDINFGAPEVLKRWNTIYFEILPASTDATLYLKFFVDGVEKGPIAVTVPGDSSGLIHTVRALASKAGVIDGRRLAIQLEQNVVDNPLFIHSVSIEYMIRGLKPTVYS